MSERYSSMVLPYVGLDVAPRARRRRCGVRRVLLLEVELGQTEHRVRRPALIGGILGEEVLEQQDRRLAARPSRRDFVRLIDRGPGSLREQLLALLLVLLLHDVRDGAAILARRFLEALDLGGDAVEAPSCRRAARPGTSARRGRASSGTRRGPARLRRLHRRLHSRKLLATNPATSAAGARASRTLLQDFFELVVEQLEAHACAPRRGGCRLSSPNPLSAHATSMMPTSARTTTL